MNALNKLALAAGLFFLFVAFTWMFVVFIASGQIRSALAILLGFVLSIAGIAHSTVDHLN